MLFHEILLLQNDLIDQSILAEAIHIEHKGKRMLAPKIKETSKSRNSQTKVLEEGSSEAQVVKLGIKQIEQENYKEKELEKDINK